MSAALGYIRRNPAVLRSLPRDAWWRARPDPLPSTPPTWPLDPATRDSLSITWPLHDQWLAEELWIAPLLDGFSRLVTVRHDRIEQPFERILLIEASISGRNHEIALDYSDYPDIDEAAAARCPVYFKMQHLREGYPHANVHPGGYTPGRNHIYRYLGRLRRLAAAERFRYAVYGRFSANFATEQRRRAITALRDQDRFDYEGDLQVVTYTRSLREAAAARVCIDLPGNGDKCHRLVDYLAVGTCIVASRHSTIMHVPLEDGVHLTYAEPDSSDLVERCARLLADPAKAAARRAAARDYFDRYLSSDQLGGYYLSRIAGELA